MLNGNWIISLTSMMVANLHVADPRYEEFTLDPIAAILEQLEIRKKAPLDISYGWVQLDGLPDEAMNWTDVDSEFIYVMKVANRGSVPLVENDLEIRELLPEGLMLRAQDYQGSGPIQTSYEFVSGDSGVYLLPEDMTYSDDGGESFDYQTNGQNYDESIGAIRIRPRGKMAAGSSFMIRFRAMMR